MHIKKLQKNLENVKNGSLRGFSNFDLEGMVINAKNHLQYEMIAESYLKPKYYTPTLQDHIWSCKIKWRCFSL